jgi:hypothetical protein
MIIKHKNGSTVRLSVETIAVCRGIARECVMFKATGYLSDLEGYFAEVPNNAERRRRKL